MGLILETEYRLFSTIPFSRFLMVFKRCSTLQDFITCRRCMYELTIDRARRTRDADKPPLNEETVQVVPCCLFVKILIVRRSKRDSSNGCIPVFKSILLVARMRVHMPFM